MNYRPTFWSYIDFHPVSKTIIIRGVPGANVVLRNVEPYLNRVMEIEPWT